MKPTQKEIKEATQELSGELGIKKSKPKINYSNLELETSHLPFFDSLFDLVGLQGEEYKSIVKGTYYFIIGRLATPYIEKIRVKRLKTDLRIHLTIPLSSGQGKKNVKTAVKKVLEELHYFGHVPTSMHPEQFIGKVINRGTLKNPKWIRNKGYLSRDFIILDEGYNLLMSKDQQIQETRKNFRIAKDPIGENLVEKKSVENTFDEEERIAYYPKVSSIQFLQPKILPSTIVEEGDFRRDLVLYVKGIAERDKTQDYEDRLMTLDNSDEALKQFINFCDSVRGELAGKAITFTDEAILTMVKLHQGLVRQGFFHSEKGANFSQMVDWTLQDFLAKLSVLLGITRGIYEITPEIVQLAFMDLFEFFNMQLDFIAEKVRGSLDYGEGWQGAKEEDQECLEWLFHAGNDGKVIELNTFKQQISKIKGCGEDMAQKYYQKYEKNQWIKINHEYQKYFVELTFTPKYVGSKLNLHAGNDSNVGNAYRNIISGLKLIIKTLPSLPTLPTCAEKV